MQENVLIDVIDDLKAVLDRLGHDYSLIRHPAGGLKRVGSVDLPVSYRLFLEHFAPNGAEIRFAQYHALTFYLQDELELVQSKNYSQDGFLVIGLYDEQPLLLKLSDSEEGDAGVFKASGRQYLRMAGSFFQFLRMFQLSLEMLGSLSDFDEAVPGYQEEEEMGYHDSYEDVGAMRSREELLEEFYNELEMIDPDGAENWGLD
ncbi:hypothetical protein COW36_10585 [bacterium (Candidatus Blackallbacteria) CG17_big_fil_post_rev_8_21_14_2_50_48_46]|uniref:Knr4/Smi1-like domain-containing protein n=1 Tax=bacterium (Candidatus Blackallbacteria) CG17_big_fil_post_rev_8_21_14_2_50_48_46 TaxID=2014261 RepID=A0A2M7G661_9BACT|nr:MAG: hypothetical protein COW64_20360 [bacterium (Candidatus Blackallbacteria) CG18_big_fil_WC_8_21_14_2_50_49_26]PIW17075.1 MAG: hypothetical protein COW36_10585 [bacterium (Candidatus Blackallbacteria) CG17_big_fil_post_rev_8_21_14_2_50_48_46]PIW47690.1 MAG: hypothetical protein COW20_11635 [bacterium (Candidatus Blackallbacteria) CG13_big_fil_rev_8_21_14_2_50_49_14]